MMSHPVFLEGDATTVRKGDREIHHNRKALWLLFTLPAISFAVACFAFSTPVHAAQTVPYKINFQGRLTNASGIALSGTHEMQIKLYTAVTGGTYVWGETRTTANGNTVTVTNGIFSFLIGEGTAVAGSSASLEAAITANTTLFAEVTIGAEVLSPRNQLGSSAYAFNSDTIDGIDGASLAQLSTANSFTNTNLITTSNANAFLVNSGSSNIFKVDTTGTGQVVVGTTDATGTVLVLDTKNDNATDPTGTAGAMYYNSTAGKFRCYQAGAWADCITPVGGATLQTAYNGSGTPATITTTAAKGIAIVAGAAPTADMFTISNVGQGVTTAGINGLAVNYAGGAAAVEGSGIRIDSTPGTTSGGTWSGLRIVANATGAVSGVKSYGIKIEGPSSPGAGSEVGLRVASGFDIGVDVASGGLQLSAMNDPASPALGELRVYAKSNAGRTMLKMKGGNGIDVALQPFLGANRVALYQPTFGSTSITTSTTLGTTMALNHFTSGTTASTAATVNESAAGAGSLFLSMKRTEIGTSTNANTVGDLRLATLQFMRGSTIGSINTGGFYAVGRFGVSTYQAGARTFAGMSGTATALANAEITTLFNLIGFGCNTADTSFSFIHNDASGTASKIPLGASFPCNTSDTDMYEYRLFSAPAGTTIYYSLSRLNTTDFIEGSVTTDIPAVGQFMTPHFYIGNSTTALRAELDIASMYVETDN